jgi:hypothetical protein
MSNHLYVVLKTPQPNLAGGMPAFLSSLRLREWLVAPPPLFQACFPGPLSYRLVEDETYLWTVTRSVHLNPVRGRLVEQPTAWAWSSCPGSARRGRRRNHKLNPAEKVSPFLTETDTAQIRFSVLGMVQFWVTLTVPQYADVTPCSIVGSARTLPGREAESVTQIAGVIEPCPVLRGLRFAYPSTPNR